jgi:type II secretory pathway pseudopilin PulG
MQNRRVVGYFLEAFVVMAILGTLSAIAIPRIGHLVNEGKVESYDSELHNIQTAVIEMLSDSITGVLKPVGPTADMSQVQTTDTPPLVLTDYLNGLSGDSIESGCTYTFTAHGKVTQTHPFP